MSASNALESLANHSTVVADTGDFESIRHYAATDATTNPSLVLAAMENPQYAGLLDEAIAMSAGSGASEQERIALAVDQLVTLFGREFCSIVPRWVSTEVDARLSFDTDATIAKGRELIALYQAMGIERERILIKIASTWEGIQAASVLESEGIRCNMTLLFGFEQAVACAQAGVTLVSPFVGRILDWHKANNGFVESEAVVDPGVASVSRIYRYYKTHGHATLVMGASFRNIGEIRALAGCDLLTIGPKFLETLKASDDPISAALSADQASADALLPPIDESTFRFALNEDAMATDRLADGIRRFAKDQVALEALVGDRLS